MGIFKIFPTWRQAWYVISLGRVSPTTNEGHCGHLSIRLIFGDRGSYWWGQCLLITYGKELREERPPCRLHIWACLPTCCFPVTRILRSPGILPLWCPGLVGGDPLLLPTLLLGNGPNKVLTYHTLKFANLNWDILPLTSRFYFQKVPCIIKMQNVWVCHTQFLTINNLGTPLYSRLLSFLWTLTNLFLIVLTYAIHQAGDSSSLPQFLILMVL